MSKELTPLEALERIGNAKTKDTSFGTEIKTNLSNEYRIIEKSLKALEIINEKDVNVGYLKYHFEKGNGGYREYVRVMNAEIDAEIKKECKDEK